MKYKLVSKEELNKLLKTAREVKQDERDEAYNNGYEDGKSEYESELEESQETVTENKATIKAKNRKIAELEVELEVLNKQKKEARDVVVGRLANEEKATELSERQSVVYKREEKLDKREAELKELSEETDNKQYKNGYADGVSDGVRKIGEITQEDRNNAMDVAKISAASHSQPETVKAVLDANTSTKKAK